MNEPLDFDDQIVDIWNRILILILNQNNFNVPLNKVITGTASKMCKFEAKIELYTNGVA